MATHLLGLLGKKRSGKDTFAARLVEHHGYTRFAFADALRDAALELDPIITTYFGNAEPLRLATIVEADGWEVAKTYPEVRRILQHMGTGIRAIDPDFWVSHVMRQVDAHDGPAVITDVRFPNELAQVRAYGWLTAAHERFGVAVRILRPELLSLDTHVSETALDGALVDEEILNDGSLVDLFKHADRVADAVAGAAQR